MVEMSGEDTVKRRTLRWSLACLYNMTDVTGLASHIICKEHNPQFKTKDQRRKFLKHLAKKLCMPLIEARIINQVVMGNHFLRSAVEMMREGRIVSPQEQHLPLPCIEAVMHPLRSLEVVIFAETRTGNNRRQEKAALLACSLFATKIQ